MDRVRKLKPKVPLLGNDNIPLRDMFELEKDLTEETSGRSHGILEGTRPESFS